MTNHHHTPPSLPHAEQDALWDAVKVGDLDTVARILEPLVEAPSTDVCQGRGETALHVASKLGLTDLVGRLVEAGASVDQGTRGGFGDLVGETPLHLACAGGRTGTVRLLIEAGANCDATRYVMRNRGLIQSCLALSCGVGDEASVRLLIDAGADADGCSHALGPLLSSIRIRLLHTDAAECSVDPIQVKVFRIPVA